MWDHHSKLNVVTLIVLSQWVISGLGVVLTPCRVENTLTQPQYATSLTSKALVQIIQIPPVFTQNVMVGKCVNKDHEMSDRPGDYFICRQRYSAVEVYVTDHKELLLGPNSTNGSGNAVQTLYNIFRTTNFIRESVVVESGCDFTFNLLPILMKNQNNSPATGTRKDDLHNYRILKSPFHKDHPIIHSTPPTSFNNNQVYVPDSSTPTIGNLQQQGYLQQPHQYLPSQQLHQQGGNQHIITSSDSSSHQGPLYSSTTRGNPPQVPQSGGSPSLYSQITATYPPSSYPSSVPLYGGDYQQQTQQGTYNNLPPGPSSMGIRERAEHEDKSSSYHTYHPHHPKLSSQEYNEVTSNESYESNKSYNATSAESTAAAKAIDDRRGEQQYYLETTELPGRPGGYEETSYNYGGLSSSSGGGGGGAPSYEALTQEGAGAGGPQRSLGEELYAAPHKVGMPLLILDKEYDPLLKNIHVSQDNINNPFVS